MTQTTVRTPLLAHGVSTQPAHIRHAGQVESALNVLFDLRFGLRKRPGSYFLTEVTGFDSGIKLGLHAIHRDDSEKYLVVHGKNAAGYAIKVYNTSGTAQTVNINSGAQTYLDNASDADDVRMRTTADTTFCVNRGVTPLVEATQDYDVFLTWEEYEHMLRYTPLVHGSRHKTTTDTVGAVAGHWQYLVDSITFPTMQLCDGSGSYTDWCISGEGGVPADYNGASVNPCGFKVAFRREDLTLSGVTCDTAGTTITKTGGFTDLYNGGDDKLITDPGERDRARTQINITGGTGIVTGWYTISSVDSADQITLAASVYAAPPGAGTSDITTDGIRDEFEVEANLEFTFSDGHEGMHEIASILTAALQEAGCVNGLIGWLPLGPETGRWSITGPYRGDQAEIFEPTSPTDAAGAGLYDLTTGVAPRAFRNDVAASSNTTGSGTADGSIPPPAARWVRIHAPNDNGGKLDEQTMPVELVRTALGSPNVFTASAITWDNRKSGTDVTNPAPSSIVAGNPIQDVAIAGNRFCLAAGEKVVMSEDGNFFNLFLQDHDNLVDSDPIEVALAGDRVAIIDSMLPFRQGLTVFTKAGTQHEIIGPFTHSTVSVDATTTIDALLVRPVRNGDRIVFVSAVEDNGVAYEYVYDWRLGSYTTDDITAHVLGLLPATITQLAASGATSMVFALTSDDADGVYVYQSAIRNSTKEQSSWTTFTIGSGSAGTFVIRALAVLESDLYLLVEAPAGGTHYLLRMPLEAEDFNPWGAPDGPGYTAHMDNMKAVTPTFSGGKTRWDYPIDADMIDRVLLEDGTIFTPSSSGWAISGTEVSVTGDYSGDDGLLGSSYSASTELSTPYPREEGGRAQIEHRLAVQRISVLHPLTDSDLEELTLKVTQSGFPDRSKSLGDDLRIDGVLAAGFCGPAEQLTVTLEGTGLKPMAAMAVSFHGEIDRRGL